MPQSDITGSNCTAALVSNPDPPPAPLPPGGSGFETRAARLTNQQMFPATLLLKVYYLCNTFVIQ